jgi:hypothetical protein
MGSKSRQIDIRPFVLEDLFQSTTRLNLQLNSYQLQPELGTTFQRDELKYFL